MGRRGCPSQRGALVLARRGCPSQRGAHPWPQAGYSRLTLASRGGVIIAIIIIVTSSSTPLLSNGLLLAVLCATSRFLSLVTLFATSECCLLTVQRVLFYQRLHILLLCAVAAAASNAEGLQQCGFKTIHLRSPGGSTSISGDSKQPREGLGLLCLILSFPVLQQLPFEFFQLFSFFGKLSIQHFQLSVKFAVHSGRQWMDKSLSHLDITSSRFCLTHSVLKCACVIVVVIFISGCV